MAGPQHAPENRLIQSLPGPARRQLLDVGTIVHLAGATVLCAPGERIRHVFFPIDSAISLITPATGDTSLEVAIVGDEGMLGWTLMLGVRVAQLQWFVQGAGQAWRFAAAPFLQQVERNPALARPLKRYVYVLLLQLAQTATCTRFHVVEQRLARWLLMTCDRAHSETLHVTHESLAGMLGVRRAGITRAASELQRRKLIQYRRGTVRIVNVRGLEAAACGCYAAGKETYARVMG